MPNTYSTLGSLFTAIANAIRAKTGSSASIVADDFPTAIANIPSGGGGDQTTEKNVNFMDYDGTLLYSYTTAEFAQLSDLPANPTHAGLVAQGWNWTKAQITSQLQNVPDSPVWVGQMYNTASGATEIDITLEEELSLYMRISIDGGTQGTTGSCTVEWGDGSAIDTYSGNNVVSDVSTAEHNYAQSGVYTIKIKPVDNARARIHSSGSTGSARILYDTKSTTSNAVFSKCIKAIRFASRVSPTGSYCFKDCVNLETITAPHGISVTGSNYYADCYNLKAFVAPDSTTMLGTNGFDYCMSLRRISFPPSAITVENNVLQQYCFRSCVSMKSITMLSGMVELGAGVFYSNYSLDKIIIPSTVTTIGSSCFNNGNRPLARRYFRLMPLTPVTTPQISQEQAWVKFLVPFASLAAYLTASNYPSPSTYTYIGFATYSNGATLPTQDTTSAYNVVWYSTMSDATNETNAITQGNGAEIYCRYTAV